MKFRLLGLLIDMNFSVMKDTMKYYTSNIKTKNNDIIKGKWQKKK